jgi:hypothetical protein
MLSSVPGAYRAVKFLKVVIRRVCIIYNGRFLRQIIILDSSFTLSLTHLHTHSLGSWLSFMDLSFSPSMSSIPVFWACGM